MKQFVLLVFIIVSIIFLVIGAGDAASITTGVVKTSLVAATATPLTAGPNGGNSSNNVSTGTDGDDWTNLTNAIICDDKPSQASTVGHMNYLYIYDYAFAIPGGSTIDSILLEIRVQDLTFGGGTWTVYPTKDGVTSIGSGTTVNMSGVWHYESAGASLFGTTWTPAEINSTNFGLMFTADSGGAFINGEVDCSKITIRYH